MNELKKAATQLYPEELRFFDFPQNCFDEEKTFILSTVVFFPPLQGFAFSGRDKPGFRPEFLPLTYLAKILSDIEEQGMCVCFPPGFDTRAFGGLRVRDAWSKKRGGGREEGSVWCFILFLCCSSEPFRGAGERGRQIRGGDGSETDTNTAGL